MEGGTATSPPSRWRSAACWSISTARRRRSCTSSRAVTGSRRWTAGARSRGACARSRRSSAGSPRRVDALAAERGFRWAPPGADAVGALAAACRTRAGVRPALERLEVPVVAVAAAEPELVDRALRPLDGAFTAVVTRPRPARRAARRARPRRRARRARRPRRHAITRSCARPPPRACASPRPRELSRPRRRRRARRGVMTLELQPVPATEALARALRDRILERRDRARDPAARARARPQLRRRPPDGARGAPAARPSGPAAAAARTTAPGCPSSRPTRSEDIFFARMPLELHTVRTLAERGEDIPAARAAVERFQALGDDVALERRRRGRPGLPRGAHRRGRARRASRGSTPRSRARSGCASRSCAPPGTRRRRSRRSTARCSTGSSPARRPRPRRACASTSTRPCATSPAAPASCELDDA